MLQVRLAQQVLLDQLVLRELQGRQVYKDQLATPGRLVQLEQLEQLVQQVPTLQCKVQLDRPVLQAQQALLQELLVRQDQ